MKRVLLIRASAGTGKTFALTNRMLALLARGVAPERILATTFTRKAAGEIRSRLFERLLEGAESSESAKELGGFLGLKELSVADVRSLLVSLARKHNRARVCTLDSFFIEILKSFSFELEVDPHWTLSQLIEERELSELAMAKVHGEIVTSGVTEIISHLDRGDKRATFAKRLESVFGQLKSIFRESEPGSWQRLEEFFSQSRDRSVELLTIREQLLAMEIPTTKQGAPQKVWARRQTELLSNLEHEDWSKILSDTLVTRAEEGETHFNRKEIGEDTKAFLLLLGQIGREKLLKLLHQQNVATERVLSHYMDSLSDLRTKKGWLSFDEVKWTILKAALMGRLADVYYRLDGQIDHLLLDEFQDTSTVEWALLEPIADEIVTNTDREKSFFCVGDGKQAIYAWRGGEAALLSSLTGRWPNIETEELQVTRRSAPAIVEMVNSFFLSISERSLLENHSDVIHHWQDQFEPHESAREDREGFVSLQLSAFRSEEDEEEAPSPAFQDAFQALCLLAETYPEDSVGILFRSNSKLEEFAEYCLRENAGGLLSSAGKSALQRFPTIQALVNLLFCVEHPGERIRSFHFESSPLYGLSLSQLFPEGEAGNFSDVLKSFRHRFRARGVGRVLTEFMSPYRVHLSEKEERVLDRFLEQAFAFDEEGGSEFSKLALHFELEKLSDTGEGQRQLLTLHASKGLEFDWVILADLDRSLTATPEPVLTHRADSFSTYDFVTRWPNKEIRRGVPHLKEMHSRYEGQQILAELCLLYVGMTRARNGLLIFLDKKVAERRSLTLGGLLRECFDSEERVEGGELSIAEEIFRSGALPTPDMHYNSMDSIDSLHHRRAVSPFPSEFNGERQRGFRVRTPSSFEGGGIVDLSRLFQSGESSARGAMLHAFFEHVNWKEEGIPDARSLLQGINSFKVSREQQTEYVNCFSNWIEELDEVFKRSSYVHEFGEEAKVTVRTENRFAFREDDTIVTGAIDRLVLVRQGNEKCFAEIIDFKTDTFIPSIGLEVQRKTKTDYYRPQLQWYRRAVSKQWGIPSENIRAKLVFCELIGGEGVGGVVEV